LKQTRNETLEVHEMEQLHELTKKLQRFYVSNPTITKLWLATTNKDGRFYVHSKP
jgi:hypothetical protein